MLISLLVDVGGEVKERRKKTEYVEDVASKYWVMGGRASKARKGKTLSGKSLHLARVIVVTGKLYLWLSSSQGNYNPLHAV